MPPRTRAALGDAVLVDLTPSPPQPLPAPVWYLAQSDGSLSIVPPHRRVLKGDPVATYVRAREFQIMWRMLYGAIPKTPVPGGMGSKPIESLSGIKRFDIFIGALPVPASGAVPVPVPPTVASLSIPDPTEASLVIGGYYVPAPPPTPPNPPGLPVWTPVAPGMMYAVQIQAFGFDEKTRLEVPGEKSATLYVETPSELPPAAYGQTPPLATPGPLSFQQGRPTPNPASGNPGIWHVQFNATRGAASYQVFGSNNPRPGMSKTIGLMDGDVLLGSVNQPPTVDSQAPVKVAFDNPFKAGDRVELKVCAVRPEQLGGNSFSPFTGSLMTVLPKTSAPAQPTSLRLSSSATSSSVPVTWNMDSGVTPPVREFRLYESGTFKMAVTAPATSATVTGYQPNSPYKLSVRAVSTVGESNPSTVLEGTTAPA
ncbi:fibronectin type III domain-containing protein [Streptomyces erythrochromogenes]|uniref:fibronectin type III domain-containing protein n=1 Tax=Streptomyces erythrochromogenes TaxID=285574 RepID=UPI003701AFB8